MLYFSTNNFWLPVSGTLLAVGDIMVTKTVRESKGEQCWAKGISYQGAYSLVVNTLTK